MAEISGQKQLAVAQRVSILIVISSNVQCLFCNVACSILTIYYSKSDDSIINAENDWLFGVTYWSIHSVTIDMLYCVDVFYEALCSVIMANV